MIRIINILIVSVFVLSSVFGTLAIEPKEADAAAAFDKTFLIDDALFTDSNSMSVAQIQQWLEDNGGTLLANWVDDVDMRRPSDNCIVHHATGMTAAEIIYEAAHNWGAQVYASNGCAINGAYWSDPGYSNYTLQTVSPKVLLTTLQKEQSLISANGSYSSNYQAYQDPTCCSSNEYKLARAMGYGVPDSGSINEKYLGFYNQINWAAWQLRYNFERSGGNTDWDEVGYLTYTGPFVEGNARACASCSLIYRSGFHSIDGSPVYMGSRATASLYSYTPHTYPGYFGNYNFVQFYTNWFGSVKRYEAALHKTPGTPSIVAGESRLMSVTLKNTGGVSWYDDVGVSGAPSGTSPVELITTKPVSRSSKFGYHWGAGKDTLNTTFGRVWGTDGKTLAGNQHEVKPGYIVKINFYVRTDDRDLAPGTYTEYIRLALADDTIIDDFFSFKVKLESSKPKAELHSKSSRETVIAGGNSEFSWVKIRNTGNTTWYDEDSISSAPSIYGRTQLITTLPLLRSSDLGYHWGTNRNVLNTRFGTVYKSNGTTPSSDQSVVKPGEVVKFNYFLRADDPSQTPGAYTEWLRLHEVGVGIVDDPFNVVVDVEAKNPRASLHSKSSTETLTSGGGSEFSWVKIKNTGNTPWYDTDSIAGAPGIYGPIELITTKPVLNSSPFGFHWGAGRNILNDTFGTVYKSNGTTLSSDQSVVMPGEVVKMNFYLRDDTSQAPGTYTEWIRLREAGIEIIDNPIKLDVIVTN